MSIRYDDSVGQVGTMSKDLDKKGFPVGGNIATDDDTAFNRQLPPGEHIENQMLSGIEGISDLKYHMASDLLKTGTSNLPPAEGRLSNRGR